MVAKAVFDHRVAQPARLQGSCYLKGVNGGGYHLEQKWRDIAGKAAKGRRHRYRAATPRTGLAPPRAPVPHAGTTSGGRYRHRLGDQGTCRLPHARKPYQAVPPATILDRGSSSREVHLLALRGTDDLVTGGHNSSYRPRYRAKHRSAENSWTARSRALTGQGFLNSGRSAGATQAAANVEGSLGGIKARRCPLLQPRHPRQWLQPGCRRPSLRAQRKAGPRKYWSVPGRGRRGRRRPSG